MEQVEIIHGLPPEHRRRAAEVFYAAFRPKFEPILRSEEHAVAILEKTLNADLAIVALWQGQLAGLASLEYGRHHFLDFSLPAFVDEFGWLRGALKLALLAFAGSRPRPGELTLDSLAVHPDVRGKGVGTRLLQAVFVYARDNDFGSVCLQVVDTNPRAQQLYEQQGFVATKTQRYPFFRRVIGFSAVTTMVKEIGS